jgi:hypothetical protein
LQAGFQTYNVNVVAPGPTGDIYVGFEDFWAEPGYTPKLYPTAIDTTPPSRVRSWVVAMGSGDPPDISNLGNNDVIGTIDSFGYAGNWLIRASGNTGSGGGCPATSTPTRTPTNTPTRTPTTGTGTATPCPMNFSDVSTTDFFYVPVRYLYCAGVISGYADGTFRPYANTTRGQLTKIVVLAFGIPIYTPPTPTFSDVPPTHTFYQYIETAAYEEIVAGYADGTFRPFNDVTRGQLSKIDVVAAGWPLINPTTPTFSDVPVENAFYTYIETAFCHGVISGYSDGTFRPFNNATRGQISKIVYESVINTTSCD